MCQTEQSDSPHGGGSSVELKRVTPHLTAQIKRVTGTYDCLIQWRHSLQKTLHSQQCHLALLCNISCYKVLQSHSRTPPAFLLLFSLKARPCCKGPSSHQFHSGLKEERRDQNTPLLTHQVLTSLTFLRALIISKKLSVLNPSPRCLWDIHITDS